ncbi:hypothetical protein FJY68_07085 [candidate division WOR-3 bacterium]|uniref:FlgD Ig-like domain-containing protein n=1 Tax=candidate division WOR-3 bacterium TaxID=2052148 RepID=A0A938BU64_UNCW3|nr:hypothetical protein [candidate division WOR-3 bacterium]
MLKCTVVSIMLVAAAVMGWEQPDSSGRVPVNNEANAHLAWGDSLVWGMFPVNAQNKTYIMTFPRIYEYVHQGDTLDSLGWDTTFTVGVHLHNTSITFQWLEQPVVWFGGTNPTVSKLYWYTSDSGQSGQVVIDTFSFADGASIVYVPNEDYSSVYWPVPGWIYCLPGDTTAFWRYSIPALFPPNLDPYGYHPGPGATIADQTPLFKWGSTATTAYRLLVSTQSDFSDTVIDEQVSSPEHEPPSNLANGTYYWRSAAWIGGAWSWCAGTRNFTLDGGWETIASIPHAPLQDGSCMAYDKGSFGSNVRSIIAIVDGYSTYYTNRYDIGQNTWVSLDNAPLDPEPGTSITTRTPVQDELSPVVMAAFAGQDHGEDAPYIYDNARQQYQRWYVWDDDSGEPFHNSYYPYDIDMGSSMVIGAGDTMYLLPSSNTQAFYWVDGPNAYGDGQQAAVSRKGVTGAHLVTSREGIEIAYQVPTSVHVRASLLDVVGRQIGYLDAGEQKPGMHRLSWRCNAEGRSLSAGAYFVLLDIGAKQLTLKAVVK